MVMIYANYGENENFCQIYLPDKVNDEQLNIYNRWNTEDGLMEVHYLEKGPNYYIEET